jgi:hypothetical protein
VTTTLDKRRLSFQRVLFDVWYEIGVSLLLIFSHPIENHSYFDFEPDTAISTVTLSLVPSPFSITKTT